MSNMLRRHHVLRLLFDSLRKFRNGNLDIASLQQNASAVMSAMEADVPKAVREAVFSLEGELDSIRFSVNRDQQAAEVERVFSELEKLMKRYG